MQSNSARASRGWYLLLLLPFVGVLWVPLYNSAEPAFAGIPYFYWYQFLWVLISAVDHRGGVLRHPEPEVIPPAPPLNEDRA